MSYAQIPAYTKPRCTYNYSLSSHDTIPDGHPPYRKDRSQTTDSLPFSHVQMPLPYYDRLYHPYRQMHVPSVFSRISHIHSFCGFHVHPPTVQPDRSHHPQLHTKILPMLRSVSTACKPCRHKRNRASYDPFHTISSLLLYAFWHNNRCTSDWNWKILFQQSNPHHQYLKQTFFLSRSPRPEAKMNGGQNVHRSVCRHFHHRSMYILSFPVPVSKADETSFSATILLFSKIIFDLGS